MEDIKTTTLWGHSLSDYQSMFELSGEELSGSILECGAGASSFNAQMQELGHNVISCDPAYISSREELTALPKEGTISFDTFLNDYEDGKQAGRYLSCQLSELKFEENQFELVLCSHYLFNQTDDIEFLSKAILEMSRVGQEVRIFPLLDSKGEVAEAIGPVMAMLQAKNFGVEIKEVPFSSEKDGNAMLRIWTQECKL